MIDMIFHQLNVNIREKIARESVACFQDLLSRARDVELFIKENSFENYNRQEFSISKSYDRCTYCRKKNHTSDVCFKRIENEKLKQKPKEEIQLSCYGCGAAGFYRSNCPTCNHKKVMESPKEMHFNSIETSIVGRNVPAVKINVNGINEEAYLDTAARTSVAGYNLYKALKEANVKFQRVYAEVTLADGSSKREFVLSTIVCINIGNRFKRIRFICLPSAKNNHTLIGIDFLEQAGIVMNLAQRIWHFVDNPNKLFEFKNIPSKAAPKRTGKNTNESKETLKDFMNWFVSNNKMSLISQKR